MMVWDIQFPRGSRSCSSLRNIDHVAVRHDRYNDRVRLGSAIALVGWWRNMQLPPYHSPGIRVLLTRCVGIWCITLCAATFS